MHDTDSWLPRLTVDLDALTANYGALCRLAEAPVAAVVKANAYGLGVAAVARTLWAAGCRTFFTAHIDEGSELRALLPDAEIILLVPPPLPDAERLRRERLTPALYRLADARALAEAAGDVALPVALHVESGIHRLAFDDTDLATLAENGLPGQLTPVLVMSHLAVADEPGAPLTMQQQQRFAEVLHAWPGVRASLANSAATLVRSRFALRPGPSGSCPVRR